MVKNNQKGSKKKPTHASGRAAATRSNTENDRLKAEVAAKDKEMAAKEKEPQEFKRRLEDLENQDKDDPNKKAKKEKHEVKPKKKIPGIWSELRTSFRNNACPHVKFLNSEEDEIEVMIRAL